MGLDFKYIDDQSPLSEEEKEGLLIKSITTRGELDELEQLNIEKADTARKEYINSIRKANNGTIESLLEFARK